MEQDTRNVNSKRRCLSGSSLLASILLGLILCMYLLENHIEIPTSKGRGKLDQQKMPAVTFKVEGRVKNITKYHDEDNGSDYITKYHDEDNGSDYITKHHGEDNGSDYISNKYIMHKLLNENGPRLSAKQRAQLVKERCQTFLKENDVRLNPNARYIYDNRSFIISRLYNVSVCYNCKVASTNTKRLLYALDHRFTDDINSIKTHVAREYATSCQKNFEQVMSNKRSINVMMVREPLERLLSAYRDERAFTGKFKDPAFAFKKYLQLVLNGNIKKMNRHIYPYFEKCRLCEMQYDFVGLQNHFNDDMKIVLQEIGASGKVNIPKRRKTGYNFAPSDKLLLQYFRKIPNELVHKLWVKYYKDYYIFGFPYPAHLMN